MKRLVPLIIAASLGGIVFLTLQSGEFAEHWDHPLYWRAAYPAMCIACAGLGYLFPLHAWAYGFVMIWAQGAYTVLTNLDAELIGVTLIILLFVSLPVSLCGVIAASLRRRTTSTQ